MRNFGDILKEVLPEDLTSGDIIRAFRKRFELTQDELCKITDLRRENLSAIENNRIEITVHYAEILGAALGIHPAHILFPNGTHRKSKNILEIEKKAKALLKKKNAS